MVVVCTHTESQIRTMPVHQTDRRAVLITLHHLMESRSPSNKSNSTPRFRPFGKPQLLGRPKAKKYAERGLGSNEDRYKEEEPELDSEGMSQLPTMILI